MEKNTQTISEQRFWEDLRSGKFAAMVKEEARGQPLNGPHEVFNIVKPIFAENDDVERLYCIFLDIRNHILGIEKMFTGTLSSSAVYPREIIKRLLALKAGAVVLVHNHPSRHTEPSGEDRVLTRKVALALTAVDALLHDHIIVGDDYYSFSEKGIMDEINREAKGFLKI
ncbi:DNA repair protein RadC domain protein [delta proteobacterium NaphS2]|nr:DNA repair protein RadC domain protein [delta proteobacterium NaphS2]